MPGEPSNHRNVVPTVVVSILGGTLIEILAREEPTTPPHVAEGYALVLTALAIGGWSWWQRRAWRESFESTMPATFVLLTAVAVLALRWVEGNWPVQAGGSVITHKDHAASSWSAVLLSTVFRPLAEEALLRGYLVSRLRAYWSERGTVAGVALLSAGIAGNLQYAASSILLGAALTVMVLRVNRLWLAAVTHALIALIALGVPARSSSSHAPAAILVTLLLFAVGLYFGLERLLRPASAE